jgi:MAF protein
MILEKSNLILASNSPRRRELLALLGIDFKIVPAEVDETPLAGEAAPEYVRRLAASKADWVSASFRKAEFNKSSIIIAADTTVVDGDQILGKPINAGEADLMLRQLRARTHQVFSGIAVALNGKLVTEICGTDVPMRDYSDQEMAAYIASGDPLDKAGAYAIQHPGFHPVDHLEGCFANVMGLPLCHLARALQIFDIALDLDVPEACQAHIDYECLIFSTIL